ncbi:hypothetical protein O3P69_002257 [Scylla paramamosain]|uniref:Uncharacterized protein n=1 Tax=Scylla paramamosain TaxID=85552 RepID=A0AAW0V5V0_SCYPA
MITLAFWKKADAHPPSSLSSLSSFNTDNSKYCDFYENIIKVQEDLRSCLLPLQGQEDSYTLKGNSNIANNDSMSKHVARAVETIVMICCTLYRLLVEGCEVTSKESEGEERERAEMGQGPVRAAVASTTRP